MDFFVILGLLFLASFGTAIYEQRKKPPFAPAAVDHAMLWLGLATGFLAMCLIVKKVFDL